MQELGWLCALVVAASAAMAYWVAPFFLVMLPMSVGFFTYFSFVRYDSQGNDRQQ